MSISRSQKYYLSFFISIFLVFFGINVFLLQEAFSQEFPFQLSVNKKSETLILMKLNYKDQSQISQNDFFSDPANVLKAMVMATPNSVYVSKIKERPGGVLILKEKDKKKIQSNLEKMLQIFNSPPSKRKTNFFLSVLALKDYQTISHQQNGYFKLQNSKGKWENRQLPGLSIDDYLSEKLDNQSTNKIASANSENRYLLALAQNLIIENISQASYSLALLNSQDHIKFSDNNPLWDNTKTSSLIEEQIGQSIFSVIKSPNDKKIAFIAADSQKYINNWPLADWNLYIANIDGSEIKKVTSNQSTRGQILFYWSPNSEKIFYHQQDHLGTYNLYSTNVEDKQVKQLTSAGNCLASLISPNGKKIAFLMPSDTENEDLFNLWTITSDGTNPYLLVKNISSEFLKWSPDSSKIAFVKTKTSNQDNYRIASLGVAYANNSKPVKYIGDFSYQEGKLESSWLGQIPLVWSKDGNKIIFTDSRLNVSGSEINDIYIVNLQDASKKLLTNNHRISYPQVSNSGKTVLFLEKGKNSENYIIWTASATGKNARQLATGKSKSVYYTFSPEGNKIAFISNNRVWVINLNSSGLTKLFDADTIKIAILV